MKNALLGAAICTLAASVSAQIGSGPYVRTFTSTLTRGFYFQVPSAVKSMIVTHVQVPDNDKSVGHKQVVALYKLTAAPPAYSATVAVTPVFYADSQTKNGNNTGYSGGEVIPVIPPLTYTAGDWFACLGGMSAPSASGSIQNSYGNAQVASSVLGQAITLYRCGVQAHLEAIAGKGSMWSENAGSIGRIHIYVVGQGAAMPYGTGSGAATPGYLEQLNPPSLGTTGSMTFRPGSTTNTGGVLALGLLRANLNLPFGTVLITPIVLYLPVPGGPIPSTGATISFPVPNNSALSGLKVTFQGGEGRSGGGLALTNGMEWTIGQ